MTKKVLIFKVDKIAYHSTDVFADKLGAALKKSGAVVEFFDAAQKCEDDLQQLMTSDYDILIDFNSKLPSLVMEDDSCYLNHVPGRFVNYILDHPAYHHTNLARRLNRYHIICLDDTHETYIRRYYPHIQSVHTYPLGAIASENVSKCGVKPFQERSASILFLGTYLDPKAYYEIIKQLPKEVSQIISGVADRMMQETGLLYEEAVRRELEHRKMLPDKKTDFAGFAQSLCLADIYVRAWFREQILWQAAETGLALTVCGEKYEESPIAACKNVQILGQVDYKKGLEMMSDVRFVLNVMPWFKSGIHDRVVNAMANGAVCISDDSARMKKQFIAGQDYISYSIADIKNIAGSIAAAVQDETACVNMAGSAFEKVKHQTFEQVAKKILELG